MKSRMKESLIIAAASWLVPLSAFAVAGPQQDSPFFGWLAVPVVAVAGRKLLKRKDSGRS